jgi:hypothetical protein
MTSKIRPSLKKLSSGNHQSRRQKRLDTRKAQELRHQCSMVTPGRPPGVQNMELKKGGMMKLDAILAKNLFAFFAAFAMNQGIAQAPPPPPPPPPSVTVRVRNPLPEGSNPVPENAVKAIFAAFDHYEVVGLDAAHGNQNLDAFILDLLHNPAFPGKINDIVVECGNSLYQPLLDRYIAGETIDVTKVQQAWRNTTQPMCGVSSFYEQFFPLLRRLNQRLPPEKRVRVLAGDPPINWNKIRTLEDLLHAPSDRDRNIASVMEREVLSKHRNALMLFGVSHLFHGPMADGSLSAVGLYEKHYPGRTLVVVDHTGFGNGTGYAKYNNTLEVRLASWPIPSLVTKLRGTWLVDLLDTTYSTGNFVTTTTLGNDGKATRRSVPELGGRKFSSVADAYLYLGPRDLLLNEPDPADVFLDKAYMAEMKRRAALMGPGPVTDQADPDKVSKIRFQPFWYDTTTE